MFDQVKPQIVFPHVYALTVDQRGRARYRRGLPYNEIRLFREPGLAKVCAPIHAGCLCTKVRAFPGVVLFEDVGSIRVGSMAPRDLNLK